MNDGDFEEAAGDRPIAVVASRSLPRVYDRDKLMWPTGGRALEFDVQRNPYRPWGPRYPPVGEAHTGLTRA